MNTVGTVNIPEEVRELTRRHLAEADARASGLIVGLYLTGSVALGDFRPQWSDIDFVAVLERVPTDDDLAALADVHAGLSPRRPYDGVYLSRVDPRPSPYCRWWQDGFQSRTRNDWLPRDRGARGTGGPADLPR